MCTADVTPVRQYWNDARGGYGMMPDFENVHTCRDFDAIKTWMRTRDSADPRVWRENAARIKATGN